MSQARRHAAPRPSAYRRKAPKEGWARRLVHRSPAEPSLPGPDRTAAETPAVEEPAASSVSPARALAEAPPPPRPGSRRARRAGWVPPEDLAEAPVVVSGESVHLPGVFRLDAGRRSWLAGLDEAPRPAAHLVEAPLGPAPVFAFPPEPEAAPAAESEPDVDALEREHPIPQQARGGRHARAR